MKKTLAKKFSLIGKKFFSLELYYIDGGTHEGQMKIIWKN